MDDEDSMYPTESHNFDTEVREQGDRETQTTDARRRELPPPFCVGDLFGDFQLERLLGRGSSGCVYRAFDMVSRRACALKILTPKDAKDLRRNKIGFRRMMGLRHPNLLRVDQMHKFDEHLAMSMEEIQGDTLLRSLRRYLKLEPHVAHKKLLQLLRHYASALAAMHSFGLVHRDIKPTNLMVDRMDRGRVIDYGLVGTFDPEADPNGFRHYIAGTRRYFSPETLYDQRYTPAGDIFSLGLVMLECLHAVTGKSDITRSGENRDKDAQLINQAVGGLDDFIPNVLREACMEMLQLDPADRPTATQMSRLGLPTARVTLHLGGQRLMGRDEEFNEVCEWLTSIYEGGKGRLHIAGPSGIGKSALIDAVERHLRSIRWGQVFRARCRPRENQPLQAFDQIADQIADRYSSCTDREAIKVDAVSASILHQAFPVLKDVVQPSMRMPKMPAGNERLDALQAAANLSTELRKLGPLILIVDDVQWADADTHAILDLLQSTTGGMLGIISVSRNSDSGQQQPPQRTINLQPLSDEVSCEILAASARRWSVPVTRKGLQELAEACGGNPFRLSELTDEFRPSGLLHEPEDPNDSSVSNLGNLDRLWQHRAKRLSSDARKLLPLIATAGCPVSMNQLSKLNDTNDAVEVSISELVSLRLAADDATGGCCIRMVHDRVTDGVLAQISQAESVAANLAWAKLLRSESDFNRVPSGRVARHLLDAGKTKEAFPFIVDAAREAELAFANVEAAEWYLRASEIVSSPETSLQQMHDAARCFEQGDQLGRASDLYQRLAKNTSSREQRLEYEVRAINLLIRTGRFKQARKPLNSLCESLGLPMVDAAIPWLAIAKRKLQLIRGTIFEARSPTKDDQVLRNDQTIDPVGDHPQESYEERATISFCRSLVRPLMMFNGPYAADLFMRLAKQVRHQGQRSDQVSLAIGSATFACCDAGARRAKGETLLRELQWEAIDLGPKIAGDFWAAKAMVNMFAMNWGAVPAAVKDSVANYQDDDGANRFEIASTQWMTLWSYWYRGLWSEQKTETLELLSLALRRNDRHAQFVCTTGLATSSLLASNETAQLQRLRVVNDECFTGVGHISLLFQFLATCQTSLFEGNYSDAWRSYQDFDRLLGKSHLSRIQLARVVTQQFGLLSALHILEREPSRELTSNALVCLKRLRSEKLPCAVTIADLYEGILHRQSGKTAKARTLLVAAQQMAKEHDLMPFQLAAEDAISRLDEGEGLGLLSHRMQNRGIRSPEKFERIYTVGTS